MSGISTGTEHRLLVSTNKCSGTQKSGLACTESSTKDDCTGLMWQGESMDQATDMNDARPVSGNATSARTDLCYGMVSQMVGGTYCNG